jgi:hypothetical protein
LDPEKKHSPQKQACFRFYAELNDFLLPARKQVAFPHSFQGNPSIKDTIEALGVPHTEVELILVNGVSVDFGYQLQHGDQVSVYPVFESIDITPKVRLRPEPLRVVRFVLDTHLGKLTSYLRMLGFDSRYRNDYKDETLAQLSSEENRILLTRDRGLLKRSAVTHGYCVRSTRPREQLIEVLRRFDLFNMAQPFQRCIRCNALLKDVTKAQIADRLPAMTRQTYDQFRQCRGCNQVYWKGSHFERMERFLAGVFREGAEDRRGNTGQKP